MGTKDALEQDMPAVPGMAPGTFVIEHQGAFIGIVRLDRRDSTVPGHIRPEGNELEVSYLLLPQFWGRGYASEAVRAVLDWAGESLPDRDVVICTQVANERSLRLAKRLGFTEAARFDLHGAAQWLGHLAIGSDRDHEQTQRA